MGSGFSSNSAHISIQAGVLKGYKLPMPAAVGNHRNITPQKLKEAAFQLYRNSFGNFSNTIFIDLFCASGQMGIESMSRGFYSTIFIELNKKRKTDLTRILSQITKERTQLARPLYQIKQTDALRYLKKIPDILPESMQPETEQKISIAMYSDPPYDHETPEVFMKTKTTLQELSENKNSKLRLHLVLQTEKKMTPEINDNESDRAPGRLSINQYDYGRHRLTSFYFL